MIACSHPGRLGDCLYALPTIKKLCEINKCECDFYTSEYCKPLENLFLAQSYINDFKIVSDYQIANHGCGTQPWQMNIPKEYCEHYCELCDIINVPYKNTYQLGFHSFPDCELHKFIAKSVGINEDLPIKYEFEENLGLDKIKPYILLAPRAQNSNFNNRFIDLFQAIHPKIEIFEIGEVGDYLFNGRSRKIHEKSCDFLECLQWLKYAKCFVGLMSSQLVLANGFPNLPKICVYGDGPVAMHHNIQSPTNYYLDKPNSEQLINLVEKFI